MQESPKIRAPQIRLLEKLCNACAVSGDEGEVRQIVLAEVKPHADEVKVDALGNVLVTRQGRGADRMRVMVAAHMDEVGFMITNDQKEGLFRFDTVGGVDARQLAGKSIVIGKEKVPGVIGINPIHLSSSSDRNQGVSLDSLRIDTGRPSNGIKPGDRATFAPNFTRIGRGNQRSLRAKAMDDRLGVTSLIELVKNAPDNIDLLAAFTVQEEVGLRGAGVAAYALDPDIAIVLDCTPAQDLPHWDQSQENTRYNARLDAGPAIYNVDRGTLSDPRLIRHLSETGDQLGIPYQFRQPGGGSTDAGAIHKARAGIPSVSLSVPGRYLHTAASLVRLSDWQNSLTLIYAALSRLTSDGI